MQRPKATDRQIDALVYELYGLTEEEQKVVQGCVDSRGSRDTQCSSGDEQAEEREG